MSGLTNAQLAAQMSDLLDRWNARERQYRDWLAGTATGGPNGDGRYPLTDAMGVTHLVACPALLASGVEGPAAEAQAALVAAEVARDLAVEKATLAAQDRDLAEAAKAASVDARDLALVYRDGAATHAADALTHRQFAEEAREGTAADLAGTTQNREDAEYASAWAYNYMIDAQAAAEAAGNYDPALYATRADGLTQIVGLMDALDARSPVGHRHGWEEIDGKPSTFTPSAHRHQWSEIDGVPSAFTPVSHAHAIGEVAGLQDALDARLLISGFTWGNLPGKPSTFTPSNHRHSWSELDNVPSAFPPVNHRHSWSELDGVPTTFTPANHSHRMEDVDSLVTVLDGKLAVDGTRQQRIAAPGAWSHHIELYQEEGAEVTPVYLRFHQANRWWLRLKADNTGLRVVNGSTDDLANFYAGGGNFYALTTTTRPTFAGHTPWDSGNLNPLRQSTGPTVMTARTYDWNVSTRTGSGVGVGGWARTMSVTGGSDDTSGAFVGGYGGGDQPSYAFLGVGDIGTGYSNPNTLRVRSTYASWGDYPLWHEGNLPVSTGAVPNTAVKRDGNGYVSATWVNAQSGVYSSETGDHFRPMGAGLAVQGGIAPYAMVQLRTSEGTTRGSLYADNSNNVGILGNDGSWLLRMRGDYTPLFRIEGVERLAFHSGGSSFYDHQRYGPVGVFDPAQTQAVWSMGASYRLPEGGASNDYGNFFGLGWSYEPGYGGASNNPQSKAGLSHQLLLMHFGVTQTAIGTGIWTNGFVDAAGSEGWVIGNKSNRPRICYAGGTFRFLTEGNAWAHIAASSMTLHGTHEVKGAQTLQADTWHYSSDGQLRLHYGGGGLTYHNSPSGHEFRIGQGAMVWFNGDGLFSNGWLRTYGQQGWYSQTYGGGIHMTDSTWIRTYGGKNLYCDAVIRADGGLQHRGGYAVPLITSSTSAPSGGQDGDVHIVY